MRRASVVLGILLFSGSNISARKPAQIPEDAHFEGPELASSGELVHPANSVAYGTVAMELTVSTTGKVKSANVIRDVPSLTSESIRVVKAWRFKPATLDGKAVLSKTAVFFVFNPPFNNPPSSPLPPANDLPEENGPSIGFSPPRVSEVIYPRYPINSVARGTVILRISVNSLGQVDAVKVVRSIASLTPEAIRAVNGWKFEPATLDGRAVSSNVVAAFLFERMSD